MYATIKHENWGTTVRGYSTDSDELLVILEGDDLVIEADSKSSDTNNIMLHINSSAIWVNKYEVI